MDPITNRMLIRMFLVFIVGDFLGFDIYLNLVFTFTFTKTVPKCLRRFPLAREWSGAVLLSMRRPVRFISTETLLAAVDNNGSELHSPQGNLHLELYVNFGICA